MESPLPLSLCIIVKNEARNILSCLESFSTLAQDIIVVDTGSHDTTPTLVESFGATLRYYTWNNSFSSARNFALSHATQPFLMMVDADDRKSPTLTPTLLRPHLDETKVIFLPYVYSQEDGITGNTAWLPRIWPAHMALKYQDPVHEYLDLSPLSSNNYSFIDGPIIHTKIPSDYTSSMERNITILLHTLHTEGGSERLHYYLVHDHLHAQKFSDTIAWADVYLKEYSTPYFHRAKVLYFKAHALLELRDLPPTLDCLKEALLLYPNFADAYLLLGDIAYTQRNYALAQELYIQALHCTPPEEKVYFYDASAYSHTPYIKLAYLLVEMKQISQALSFAKKGLTISPHSIPLQQFVKKFSL